jgi:hypothetical protein
MPNKADIQGFIDSAKIYNDIGENKQRYELAKTQSNDNYLLNQARLNSADFNLEKDKYEFSRQQELDRKARNEQALIAQAFKSTMPDRLSKSNIDGDTALGSKYVEIGTQLLASNPTEGMKYIKQGEELKTKAVEKVKTDLELRAAKVDAQGEVASGVFDDASAKQATAEMAKLGFVVPEKYQNYSTEAQEWWKNRAMFSKNYSKSIKAENDALRAQATVATTKRKEEEFEFKKKESDRKQILTREKIAAGKSLKFATPKEQSQELRLLADADERFADLDSEVQSAVVKDVHSAALAYLKEDPSLDQKVALQRARRDVLGLIGEDGTYKVVADKPVGKPVLAEWLPAAMKANPNMTEAEITAIYNKKYGK